MIKSDNRKSFMIYGALTIVFAVLIFIVSVIPTIGGINIFSFNRFMYFLHAIEFFIFAFLLFKTFYYYGSKNPYLLTFCIAIAIAVLSEFIQLYVSYRTFNPLDIASDGIGAFAALLVVGFIK